MAAPEWHDALEAAAPAQGGTAASARTPAGTVPAADVAGAAAVLISLCGGVFEPVVLAQLDAALAHELAARARERSASASGELDRGVREGRPAAYLARQAGHAGACKASATKAGKLAAAASNVVVAFGGQIGAAGFDPAAVDRVDGAALVDVVARLEEAKNALTAIQVQAETLFAAQQRLAQARTGVPKSKLGKGVGLQVGLARRASAHHGRQLIELAAVLVRELPHTMNAITAGVIGEDRGRIVATETVFLSAEHRAMVDEIISADREQLATWGTRQLAARAREAAYALEPEAFTARREKAVTERHVSLRPAADGMTLLSALIPLKHGVAIYKTLSQVADAAKADGDARGRGQLMADALTHRLTRHAPCDDGAGGPGDHRGPTQPTPHPGVAQATTHPPAAGAALASGSHAPGGWADRTHGPRLCTTVAEPAIMIELVMTDRALFDGANDPAILLGYDPVPAPEARTMVHSPSGGSSVPSPAVWLKRLFTHPGSGALLAMDSRAGLFPEGMKEFLRLQYQRCATPYCDAPIRQYDHIKAWAAGGATTTANGQGTCTACNQDKEAPGWNSEPLEQGTAPPRTRITTPTGHTYSAVAPPLPGPTRRQRPRRC